MRSIMTSYAISLPRAARLLSLAVLLILVSLHSTSRADVSAAGDTSPAPGSISDAGGPVGGDLIIGNTGVAGLFMDIAPPLFGTLAPLESDDGIIGNQEGSIGAATFEDFLGGDWIVNNTLFLGNGGQGFLDLFDSASVTASDIIVGAEETGLGVGTINGQGSRILTDGLIVGDLGYGQLDVNNRAAVFSGNAGGDSIIGNQSGGVGVVTVTGIGSRWSVGSTTDNADLIIGDGTLALTNPGQGTLNIVDQGQVLVAGSTTIGRGGRVNLATGGRLRKLTSVTALTTIQGVLSGDGFVDGDVLIGPLGQVRNAAGIANTRERLVFSGPVVNNGTIEILGGEMDFNASLLPLINNLEIVVRDGVMRFPAGLANEVGGSISIGGNSTLHGTITNNGGSLQVLAGSESLVVGDLLFTAGILGLTVGPAAGTLDITGSADLTGALFALDYSAGVLPQPGDSYQIFNAPGGITGAFPQVASAGGRLWDITLNPGMDTLIATATAAVAVPFGADFNGDGTVNQLDLQIWQANFGRTSPPDLAAFGDADGDGDVDGRDLLEIQRKFGGPPLVAAATAVPEPSVLVLLFSAAIGLGWRRR